MSEVIEAGCEVVSIDVAIPSRLLNCFKIGKRSRLGINVTETRVELTNFDYTLTVENRAGLPVASGRFEAWGARAEVPFSLKTENTVFWEERPIEAVPLFAPSFFQLEWLALAADEDNGRFALGCVAFSTAGAVATDGRRLHAIGQIGRSSDYVCLVPIPVLETLSKLKPVKFVIAKTGESTSTITGESKLFGAFTIVFREIEGRYPNVADIVPSDHSKLLALIVPDVDKMKTAIRQTKVKNSGISDIDLKLQACTLVNELANCAGFKSDGDKLDNIYILDLLSLSNEWNVYATKAGCAYYFRGNSGEFALIMPLNK